MNRRLVLILIMSENHVVLKSIKSFFVGGSTVPIKNVPVKERQVVANAKARRVDMNGTYTTGQMYVQEYMLAQPQHELPVLLWHGGGMTGSQWEATPDDRDGWLWFFLRKGFNVYVSDAAERGRSSWLTDPAAQTSAPIFRSKEEAWPLFRIGPAYTGSERLAFKGQQFPDACFDEFAKQFVPRWLGHEAMALRAYESLLQKVGRCIVVGHSQGGGYAVQLAQTYPELIQAVVALEPTGMPVSCRPNVAPHLLVWGDHFEHSELWTDYRNVTDAYWTALVAHGNRADVLDLPSVQIKGNSHFCMMDRNSDQIAGLACDWLKSWL